MTLIPGCTRARNAETCGDENGDALLQRRPGNGVWGKIYPVRLSVGEKLSVLFVLEMGPKDKLVNYEKQSRIPT